MERTKMIRTAEKLDAFFRVMEKVTVIAAVVMVVVAETASRSPFRRKLFSGEVDGAKIRYPFRSGVSMAR